VSRAAKLASSKAIGGSVESEVIDTDPKLEYVPDSETERYDAITVDCLDPSCERPHLGIPLVESGTEVEIKGACVVRSNGSRQSPGHWYIRRESHEWLLDFAGVYLLAVYAPREDTPILRSVIIPASLLDEILAEYWYVSRACDRPDRTVAQISWTRVIDRERVPGAREVDRRV